MNRLSKYFPLLLSLLLYGVLWWSMHGVLGYNLDSDCVSYLTIAERVSNGDWWKSINGLWSPLNSWLLAPFIYKGYNAWEAAKLLNFGFGFILQIQAFFLFRKYCLQPLACYLLQIALAIAMVYFVYFQMFGDVLQMIFVLFYLFVLLNKRATSISISQAILSGFIIGIAFYAKAYSLFFFFLHFLTILIWYVYSKRMQWKKAMVVYCIGVLCALIVVLPWTFALHKKYGEWTITGHAGKLNMSWYINSGKSFNPNIQLLIPPTYADSPSFWEDPYLSQSNLSGPFTSTHHFAKWIMRVLHTKLVAVWCFNEISFFALSIICIGIFYFFCRKRVSNDSMMAWQMQLLLITICILPLGYLMMHIETRYIWIEVFLSMVLGAKLMELAFAKVLPIKYLEIIAYAIFAFSFVVFPMYQFGNLRYKNKDLFETADALKHAHIHGKFTSNVGDAGRMWVIAYLTKSNFYTIEQTGFSNDILLSEMKRYEVEYYFYETENSSANCQIDGLEKVVTIGNLQVFRLSN